MDNFVTAAIIFGIYFFPGLVAELRRHRNRTAIAILNLLLGWTVLGWIAALVWAATNDIERRPT